MGEQNPFEGVDTYTDPAEITEDHGVEDPEASPASVASAIGSFNASVALTNTFGC
ncbi:LxmA leader domain family RiPP [Nocardiopsis valliformis]|uniref:LxmA leader domain family RiPP n=1 Tax=Nocardiopsis valliformis TaxID=239974 RepID=UPI0003499A29|nr:LxmA leader domain family RiPP [Nocardiopsis valliformis]